MHRCSFSTFMKLTETGSFAHTINEYQQHGTVYDISISWTIKCRRVQPWDFLQAFDGLRILVKSVKMLTLFYENIKAVHPYVTIAKDRWTSSTLGIESAWLQSTAFSISCTTLLSRRCVTFCRINKTQRSAWLCMWLICSCEQLLRIAWSAWRQFICKTYDRICCVILIKTIRCIFTFT